MCFKTLGIIWYEISFEWNWIICYYKNLFWKIRVDELTRIVHQKEEKSRKKGRRKRRKERS
jgi:hypothetical protein